MLVTTYQHDYIPPYTKRYEFPPKHKGASGSGEEECQCIETPLVDIPKSALDACDQRQGNVEWTNIAPMGRLIEPRLIPTKLTPEQISGMANESSNGDCFKEQPNRFLKLLRTLYPDLYERLKQMPKDEMSRRLERERLLTTYQIDFCSMNEYPEGVYDSLKHEEDTAAMLNAQKLLHKQDACAEFRANIMQELQREGGADSGGQTGAAKDPCQKAYKPFKISFTDSARFVASGNNSHWRANIFTKKANFSEYMDTINKNGCIILKNRIHDHSKCVHNHCRHQLEHTCTNLK